MATGWVKSLQCKSRALDDVVRNTHHKTTTNHHHHLLSNAASCRKSVQSLKDVVETNKSRKSKPPPKLPHAPPDKVTRRSVSTKSESISQQPPPPTATTARSSSHESTSTRRSRSAESFFPALTELPEGHPSRNVVEIIFHTSWSPKAFSGRIEMVFKVQNLSRTVTRFEEYREIVKSRADSAGKVAMEGEGEDHARCVADGNEVMRFYCLGSTSGGAYDAGGGAWTLNGGKGAAICTFSGSGTAHENAGGGRGRRAMLVCRVIAGRVCKQLGFESLIEGRVGYDSVSGENGELLVFDSRAVLPCFLIIYKL
ncbi:hypothetical protein M9H77_32857 [Catharanthus roseus]|uniref:Uncharacterized protein n=1 Tax=Catharanthus roseus TaxID=4058 RepID=A0ACC0A5Z0_CATRO|nr:hypothetical protein M9H77_32857 [Catharanthus roseus]